MTKLLIVCDCKQWIMTVILFLTVHILSYTVWYSIVKGAAPRPAGIWQGSRQDWGEGIQIYYSESEMKQFGVRQYKPGP